MEVFTSKNVTFKKYYIASMQLNLNIGIIENYIIPLPNPHKQ